MDRKIMIENKKLLSRYSANGPNYKRNVFFSFLKHLRFLSVTIPTPVSSFRLLLSPSLHNRPSLSWPSTVDDVDGHGTEGD